MAGVSWDAKYDINIEGIDGDTVHHLREAIAKYLTSQTPIDDDSACVLDEIMQKCDTIISIDEED